MLGTVSRMFMGCHLPDGPDGRTHGHWRRVYCRFPPRATMRLRLIPSESRARGRQLLRCHRPLQAGDPVNRRPADDTLAIRPARFTSTSGDYWVPAYAGHDAGENGPIRFLLRPPP